MSNLTDPFLSYLLLMKSLKGLSYPGLNGLLKSIISFQKQTVFRKGHNSINNITRLEIHTSTSLNSSRFTLVVDWSDASGNLLYDELLDILISEDIPHFFIPYINSFLTERCFYVQINETKGDGLPITWGLFQGGVLNPLLFNLYVSKAQVSQSVLCLIGWQAEPN